MFSSRIANSRIVLAGCAIAAALATAAPMSAGATPAAMPTSEWRSLPGQNVDRAPGHAPRMQRLAGPAIASIGQGWG